MHQNFSAGDVAEGKERVDRYVLEPLQTMACFVGDRYRPITPSGGTGTKVIRMGPIGHVIQIVVPAARIVRLVLA